MTVLIPVVLAGWSAAVVWPDLTQPGMGGEAVRQLLLLAAAAVFVGGTQFASRAVCWEASSEMRDLVRLTGIEPKTLLWATTLSRWWTIGWSLLLMLPLAMLARTFGGVRFDQLQAGAYGLALLAALTGGFGMLAGVLTVDAKNPEKTASSATWIALVAYNVGFVLLSQAVYWGNELIAGSVSPSLDRLSRRIAYGAPVVSVSNALRSPDLFSPTDPGYWLHFLPAIGGAVLATLAMDLRFRSSARSSHREGAPVRPVGLVAAGRRPRCSDCPFFWKDVYVLSEEQRRLNTWTLFYCAATIGVVVLGFGSLDSSDSFHRVAVVMVANLSVVGAALIVSLRFDALLTAEFRDRTWGSLMLLPVDPCKLLLTKLWAALWEQRFAMLTVGVALMSLLRVGSRDVIVATSMVAIIAPLVSCLLCQMSCITLLLGKPWWVGPCQAAGFITVLVVTMALWINAGLWPGFVLTAACLMSLLMVVQFGCVNRLARNWIET